MRRVKRADGNFDHFIPLTEYAAALRLLGGTTPEILQSGTTIIGGVTMIHITTKGALVNETEEQIDLSTRSTST